MASWDIFHSDRMGISRGLSSEQVREAVARGEIREDDLVRPAGSGIAWKRLSAFPALLEGVPRPQPSATDDADIPATQPWLPADEAGAGGDEPAPTPPPTPGSGERAGAFAPVVPTEDESWAEVSGTRAEEPTVAMPPSPDEGFAPPSFDDLNVDTQDAANLTQFNPSEDDRDEAHNTYLDALVDDEDEDEAAELDDLDLRLGAEANRVALPLSAREAPGEQAWIDEDEVDDIDLYDPLDEDEEAAEFTLSRGSPDKVEELDLAAMVDVAFQLVLFFLVTSTTVLFKTLEVPKPNPETAQSSAAQGQGKSLEDLQQDYILVDIDPAGTFKIDHEPVAANLDVLIKRLREARSSTGRLSMLLTADAVTLHKFAVLAYDAANEIGLRIAIARPKRE